MIELISIVCSLIVCIFTPFEVNRIRKGGTNKKFAGNRAGYIAAYRKQLTMLTWVGLVLGVLTLALSFVESNPGERIVKYVAAAIWFAVSAVCFISKRSLADVSIEQPTAQPTVPPTP